MKELRCLLRLLKECQGLSSTLASKILELLKQKAEEEVGEIRAKASSFLVGEFPGNEGFWLNAKLIYKLARPSLS